LKFKFIKQLSPKQTKAGIDIQSFAAGVYIVKVNNDKEA
jgi:hypothetical protein